MTRWQLLEISIIPIKSDDIYINAIFRADAEMSDCHIQIPCTAKMERLLWELEQEIRKGAVSRLGGAAQARGYHDVEEFYPPDEDNDGQS